MHIADFNYPRSDFKVWCKDHIDNAEAGAIVFTISEYDASDMEYFSIDSNWQCAIFGPEVSDFSCNCPNISSETDTYVK